MVSIVTPFYNTGAMFGETARSVMQQSLRAVGSDDRQRWNDRSQNLYGFWMPTGHWIRACASWITGQQGSARGQTPARARRGRETCLYLDSDDLLEPTAAEKWLWFLESFPQYSFAGGYLVGFGAHEYLWHAGFQNQGKNLDQNQINHIIMARKAVVQAVGGYDESIARAWRTGIFGSAPRIKAIRVIRSRSTCTGTHA